MTKGPNGRPLTPPACALQDFPFIPVDVQRLLKSDTWVLATGEERAAAMSLWLESWHQIPAASLPNNDRMLAHLSLSRNWNKVKAQAMRGWVLCSDDRYYHPVVAEKALEAWIEKLIAAIAGANGNAKRWGVAINVEDTMAQLTTAIGMLKGIAPRSKTLKKKSVLAVSVGIAPGAPIEATPASPAQSGGDRKGEGEGEGQRQGTTSFAGGAPSAAPPAKAPSTTEASAASCGRAGISSEPPTNATWRAYAAAFELRYGVSPERNQQSNGLLANLIRKVSKADLPDVVAFYVKNLSTRYYVERRHPLETFCRDYHSIRTQWAQEREGVNTLVLKPPDSPRAERIAGFAGHAAAGAPQVTRTFVPKEITDLESFYVPRIER